MGRTCLSRAFDASRLCFHKEGKLDDEMVVDSSCQYRRCSWLVLKWIFQISKRLNITELLYMNSFQAHFPNAPTRLQTDEQACKLVSNQYYSLDVLFDQ